MRGFLDELRRRKLTKTAAIYAVVAWVTIEVSSVIFPALHLPDWTVTFVVALAVIGFPVTLIFAWIFDVTPGGVVRTLPVQELPPDQLAAMKRGRALDFAVIAVLLGVIGWLGWERLGAERETSERGVLDSIAVLPFMNMSGDPENEYFGDGLAEELLNALVRVEGLRVAARTSSFEYKGQNLDVRRIGEALNVATVLEGSVRRAGDRVRVTAQLIRTNDGFHLWSETFDRKLEDIFALQDEISLSIVDALRVTLGTAERARVTRHATTDVVALEAYMKGRFEFNKRTGAALRRAIAHFEEAIEADPAYARAYSGLSDTWVLMSSYAGVGMEEATAHAEPYARRALELDPDLAEAHASLGLVLRNKNDTTGSIEPLERATRLNPSYSPAFHWLGLSYASVGRLDESIGALRRAVAIDPQYLTAKRALAGALRNLGRHDEADAMWVRVLQDHPSDPFSFYGAAADSMQRGEFIEAFRRAVRAVELEPRDPTMRAIVIGVLMQVGDHDRASEQVEVIRALNPEHATVRGFAVALATTTLDDDAIDAALATVQGWPAGVERIGTLCGLTLLGGELQLAVSTCRETLQAFGWAPESSDPLPGNAMNFAANLMLAAREIGDTTLEAQLQRAIRDHFTMLAEAGLDAFEVRWVRALLDMLTGGPVDPFLDELPQVLSGPNWQVRTLDRNPMFRRLYDNPRFEAIVAEAIATRDAARAQMDGIPIPGI